MVRMLAEALLAMKAYYSNNTGANAARKKAALEALPRGWERLADPEKEKE